MSNVSKILLNGVEHNITDAVAQQKLSGVQEGAQANVQSDWNATGGDAFIKNKPTSLPANGGNAATVNNHSVNADVPAGAKFTDTTYQKVTTSADGLMSKEDKTKLDGMDTAISNAVNALDSNATSTDGTNV